MSAEGCSDKPQGHTKHLSVGSSGLCPSTLPCGHSDICILTPLQLSGKLCQGDWVIEAQCHHVLRYLPISTWVHQLTQQGTHAAPMGKYEEQKTKTGQGH